MPVSQCGAGLRTRKAAAAVRRNSSGFGGGGTARHGCALLVGAVAVWLLSGGTAQAIYAGGGGPVNLVANGDFESGSLSDWSLTPASPSGFSIENTVAYDGTYAAEFDATSPNRDVIAQTLTTVPGQDYTISFWLLGGKDNALIALWDNSEFFTMNAAVSDWTEETFTLTASSDSTVLAFSGQDTPAAGPVYLDDVTVVPEPTTLLAGALLLLPFGASTLRLARRARNA